MSATHYARKARALNASGAYNQAQTELYIALRYLNERKGTSVCATYVARGVNRWIVDMGVGPGGERVLLLRTPVFADVCDLIVLLDADA
jgi:hypothetical protein